MVVTSTSSSQRNILRGTCKTPPAILNDVKATLTTEKIQSGLAIALQHFGAACARLDNLEYTTFLPIPHMTGIFQNEIADTHSKGLYIGHQNIHDHKLTGQPGPTDKEETPIVIDLKNYRCPDIQKNSISFKS